jgi:prolyl-tRNA synthetase
MGSYGIGPARLMGAIAETFSDEKGIYWPEHVAPFRAHVIMVQPENKMQRALAEETYSKLLEAGIDTLLDDRLVGAGEKFADSELIGIPHRITIGKRALETEKVEYTYRSSETPESVGLKELIEKLSTHDKKT